MQCNAFLMATEYQRTRRPTLMYYIYELIDIFMTLLSVPIVSNQNCE